MITPLLRGTDTSLVKKLKMSATNSKQLILEACWWAFTFILVILVLLPVKNTVPQFPFYLFNIAAICVAVTMTRYIFSLHINWIRNQFLLQGILAFLMIPAIFFIGQGLNEYITYLDNNGPDVFVRHLPIGSKHNMQTYLNTEYYFFGVWAITAGVVFPLRMIAHIWKNYKK